MTWTEKILKRILIFAVILPALAFSPMQNDGRKKTEIVFCLDLSASTNGLLNDIRDNLWQFINNVNRSFPETDVRIGVVVFARPSFGAENFYAKSLCDITEDYDLISYNLFQLRAYVEKGVQCDGSALYTGLKEMNWSKDPATKKMIYLFGNGNPKLCGYDYMKACEIAIKNNISINTVYCDRGKIDQKNMAKWSEIAETTGGKFHTFTVVPRTASTVISEDAKWLDEVNAKLQDTYLFYTKEGKERFDMMVVADQNSKRMESKFYYSRCQYKLSPHYEEQCRQWDLISLMKTTSPDFSRINRNYLSPEYQNVTAKDLEAIAHIKAARRELLVSQMRKCFMKLNIENPPDNPIDSILLTRLQ